MTTKKTAPPGPPASAGRRRRYRVLTDRLTYSPKPGGDRIRPGEGAIVDDLAPSSVVWLLEAGAIEEVK